GGGSGRGREWDGWDLWDGWEMWGEVKSEMWGRLTQVAPAGRGCRGAVTEGLGLCPGGLSDM
ncbi:MAG TPA: hypothetical protein DCR26_04405, partial [Porphyromonadaceae bacterium]|nr:hypothetical protein [Porphyromonadaceae bacterium]